MKLIYLIIPFLLFGLVNAVDLTTTTVGNFSFIYSDNQSIAEKLDLTINNNNDINLNGFSCVTYAQKDNITISSIKQNSYFRGQFENQIKSELPIDDKFAAYDNYTITIKCISNSNDGVDSVEEQSLSYLIYIYPSPKFNLSNNFIYYLRNENNAWELIWGAIILSFVLLFIKVWIEDRESD